MSATGRAISRENREWARLVYAAAASEWVSEWLEKGEDEEDAKRLVSTHPSTVYRHLARCSVVLYVVSQEASATVSRESQTTFKWEWAVRCNNYNNNKVSKLRTAHRKMNYHFLAPADGRNRQTSGLLLFLFLILFKCWPPFLVSLTHAFILCCVYCCVVHHLLLLLFLRLRLVLGRAGLGCSGLPRLFSFTIQIQFYDQ